MHSRDPSNIMLNKYVEGYCTFPWWQLHLMIPTVLCNTITFLSQAMSHNPGKTVVPQSLEAKKALLYLALIRTHLELNDSLLGWTKVHVI